MPDSFALAPLGGRSPLGRTQGGAEHGEPHVARLATLEELNATEPRWVIRKAMLEVAHTMGPEVPIDRLVWWFQQIFDAGMREGRAAAKREESEKPGG